MDKKLMGFLSLFFVLFLGGCQVESLNPTTVQAETGKDEFTMGRYSDAEINTYLSEVTESDEVKSFHRIEKKERTLKAQILAINDFHGQIDSGKFVSGRPVGSAPVLGSYPIWMMRSM